MKPSMDSGVTVEPILVFKITAADLFRNSANFESIRASLQVNPKLTKAFGRISLLIKVGTAIAEVIM